MEQPLQKPEDGDGDLLSRITRPSHELSFGDFHKNFYDRKAFTAEHNKSNEPNYGAPYTFKAEDKVIKSEVRKTFWWSSKGLHPFDDRLRNCISNNTLASSSISTTSDFSMHCERKNKYQVVMVNSNYNSQI